MIGNCDACDRKNVPVSNGRSSSGETTQCFLCQGDANPDPYCELESSPLNAAENLLIAASIGSCTCMTKSPDLTWHAPDCRYVMIMMALENVEIASGANEHIPTPAQGPVESLTERCRSHVAETALREIRRYCDENLGPSRSSLLAKIAHTADVALEIAAQPPAAPVDEDSNWDGDRMHAHWNKVADDARSSAASEHAKVADWLDDQARIATNSLHCGDNSAMIQQTHDWAGRLEAAARHLRAVPQASGKPRLMCICCDEQEVSNDGDECEFCRITYSVTRPHGRSEA